MWSRNCTAACTRRLVADSSYGTARWPHLLPRRVPSLAVLDTIKRFLLGLQSNTNRKVILFLNKNGNLNKWFENTLSHNIDIYLFSEFLFFLCLNSVWTKLLMCF